MAYKIRRADYFYTTINEEQCRGYRLLSDLAGLGVNLFAFTGVPVGPARTQMTLFPADSGRLLEAARKAGLSLDGPHTALLVQGDDELGALARIHTRLDEAKVHVYASSGVADGKGAFGYILYVRPADFERAARALDV